MSITTYLNGHLIAKIDDTPPKTPSIFMDKNLKERLNRLRDKVVELQRKVHAGEISADRIKPEVNQLTAHLKDIARKYGNIDNLSQLLQLEARAIKLVSEYSNILNSPQYSYLYEKFSQIKKDPTAPNALALLEGIENELRQIIQTHHKLVTELETMYADVLGDPGYANLHRWLEEVRKGTSDEIWSLLESSLQNAQKVRLGDYPKNTTYDKRQFKTKIRRHMEQIERTAKELGVEVRPHKRAKATSPEVQENIKNFINEVVKNGETRQIPYKNYPSAIWSRWGNAIVVRQSDGKFVSFFDAIWAIPGFVRLSGATRLRSLMCVIGEDGFPSRSRQCPHRNRIHLKRAPQTEVDSRGLTIDGT